MPKIAEAYQPSIPKLLAGAPTKTPSARPIVKWVGGKRGLLPALRRLAPTEYRTYYEPFLGGGSFFLDLAPRTARLSDANHDLIALYSTVRDNPAGVAQALDRLRPEVGNRSFYYRLRGTPLEALPAVERAARFIFLNKTGYNGLYRVNRQGQFNVPFGRHASPPKLYDHENIFRVAQLLARVELGCGDFETLLDQAGEGDFAYLDPPYVPISPTANFTGYTSDLFAIAQQTRLAAAVRRATARGAYVLISNSDSQLARELYDGYEIHIVHSARAVNSDTARRGKIQELAIVGVPGA